LGVAEDHSLDRDLIVIFRHPGEDRLLTPQVIAIVGVELGSQLGILGDRQLLQRSRRLLQQDFIGPVDILAADGDDASRQAAEKIHQSAGLLFIAQQEIDYDIGRDLFELGAVPGELIPVADDSPHRIWQNRSSITAMNYSHVMPLPDQIANHEGPDKARPANDQNLHTDPPC
jgi:hypothetical protein